MAEEFINPNWHVMLIHFPIGLLSTGILAELVSLKWPNYGLRNAARWMIFLGCFLAVPTAIAGIYAFRDILVPGEAHSHSRWYETVEANRWTEDQWKHMRRHAWFNGLATGDFLLVMVTWLASSDKWRRQLYWPFLLLLGIGLGPMIVGAWYAGETVYRHGTAVSPEGARSEAVRAHEQRAGSDDHTSGQGSGASAHGHGETPGTQHSGAEQQQGKKGLTYFLPPLQLHVVSAGFVFALSFLSLGLMFRTMSRSYPVTEQPMGEDFRSAAESGPASDLETVRAVAGIHTGPTEALAETPEFHPSRFWMGTALLALLVAAAGVWTTNEGQMSIQAFRENLRLLGNPEYLRLILHVVVGVTIVLLPLATALACRNRRGQSLLTGSLAVLLCFSIAVQIWLGVLMLFDSPRGPLTKFSTAPATTERNTEVGHSH